MMTEKELMARVKSQLRRYMHLGDMENGIKTSRIIVGGLCLDTNAKQLTVDGEQSTSGNMPTDIENIDLKKLIEQTLADMEDRVDKSGLVTKVMLPENPLHIFADGKKLYRVFQNVIDNALKYSFKGTRVYISLEERNGKAIAIIKNTAGYEMDFTAEEILQRFNRGDKSRTTEGSGLGLSIAESFTQVCGGTFRVDIAGDLFKVTVSFTVTEQNKEILPLPDSQLPPVPRQ